MSSTKQILSGVTIFVCLKFANTIYVPMNKPDSVLVPMSYDELINIHWMGDDSDQLQYIYNQCGCLGMDFDIGADDDYGTIVMFSTDSHDQTVTYEMMTAHMLRKNRLNFKRVVQRKFVLNPTAKIFKRGGYMIPNIAVIDSDNFNSYMTLMLCLEGANIPVIIHVVRNVDNLRNSAMAMKYLEDKNLYYNMFEVIHKGCLYAEKIV